jgi:hypothetical protein
VSFSVFFTDFLWFFLNLIFHLVSQNVVIVIFAFLTLGLLLFIVVFSLRDCEAFLLHAHLLLGGGLLRLAGAVAL